MIVFERGLLFCSPEGIRAGQGREKWYEQPKYYRKFVSFIFVFHFWVLQFSFFLSYSYSPHNHNESWKIFFLTSVLAVVQKTTVECTATATGGKLIKAKYLLTLWRRMRERWVGGGKKWEFFINIVSLSAICWLVRINFMLRTWKNMIFLWCSRAQHSNLLWALQQLPQKKTNFFQSNYKTHFHGSLIQKFVVAPVFLYSAAFSFFQSAVEMSSELFLLCLYP